MSKLLFLYEFETPTTSIMRSFYENLTLDCVIEQAIFLNIKDISSKILYASDVVVFIRATDSLSVHIAKECRQLGKFSVAFYDDDLLNRPFNKPRVSWRNKNVERLLSNSNVIFSCSERICEKYRLYTIEQRSIQLDSAVQYSELRSTEKKKDEIVRIVYAANSSHAPLFEKYIKPVFPKLGNVDKKIELTFIGVYPEIPEEHIPHNMKLIYVKGMSFEKYRKYMNSHNFDIGLAPLEDDEFSKCKYINKFLEYSIFQIPCIFSKTEPYTSVVIDKENGYLVENTVENWENALCNAIINRNECERCGVNAIELVRSNFNYEHIAKQLLTRMPEFHKFKAPQNDIKLAVSIFIFIFKFEYGLARFLENLFLAWKYFKILGFHGLIRKISIHIIETKNFTAKKSNHAKGN